MTAKRKRTYGADTSTVSFTNLLPEATTEWLSSQEIIVSSQPRRYFDPLKQEQLIRSIQEQGILEPLIVRPLGNQQYGLVAGERRYRAAVHLNLEEIPVVIKELSDQEALKINLTENLQRDDLNPIDETEAILQLLSLELDQTLEQIRQMLYQMKNIFEKFKSQKMDNSIISKDNLESRDNVIPKFDSPSEQIVTSVLESLGYNWYSFICNRLPLLKLPKDILQILREGKLEYTKAKEIAKVKDESQRINLLENATEASLSLSEIKKKIKELSSEKIALPSPKNDLQALTRRLNQQKLWEKDPRTWKKIERLLDKVNSLSEGAALDSLDISDNNENIL